MHIDSVIFDLDGTLWDSTDGVLKAWKEILETKPQVKEPFTRELLESLMGLQVQEIGEKVFYYLNKEEQVKLVQECCQAEHKILLKEGGILYEDLEEVLQSLSRKYQLFIVSNCECGYIETFLEHHKLKKYFKDIECAGNTGFSKGENIKLVIKRNNLKNPIYVGDTQGDCNASKIANIPFAYASYGFGTVDSYDYYLKEFKDIVIITK